MTYADQQPAPPPSGWSEWAWYHLETEAFDRGLRGRWGHGASWQPAQGWPLRASQQNAHREWKKRDLTGSKTARDYGLDVVERIFHRDATYTKAVEALEAMILEAP